MPSPKTTTSLIGNRPKVAPEPAPPPMPNRWYRVASDRQVPRAGGSYLLRAGKEINSANYDIPALRRAGVDLVEIPTPPWFLAAQEASVERHAQLVAAGADLGDHPPPYEAPAVLGPAPATSPTS